MSFLIRSSLNYLLFLVLGIKDSKIQKKIFLIQDNRNNEMLNSIFSDINAHLSTLGVFY